MDLNDLPAVPKRTSLAHLVSDIGRTANASDIADGGLRVGGVYDIGLSHLTASPTIVKAQVAAVGFTGQLPPGALLIVCHEKDAPTVMAAASQHPSGSLDMAEIIYATTDGLLRIGDRVCVLHPGDVVRFARPIRNLCLFPWMSPDISSDWIARPGGNAALITGAIAMPLARARIWEQPGLAPDRIGYSDAPLVHPAGQFSAEPSTTTQGVEIAAVPCTVTLHFTAYLSTPPARLGAGFSNTWEVWWLMPDGTWAHSHDDDLDSAGRQPVTEYHDVETYAVPGNASRLYLRNTGTLNCANCSVIVTSLRGAVLP